MPQITETVAAEIRKNNNIPAPTRLQSSCTSTQSGCPALHKGYTCDGCSGAIYGFRYRCSVLEDFDLCEKCEASVKHPYPLIKISPPAVSAPATKPSTEQKLEHKGYICDGCDGPIIGSRFKCSVTKDFDLCECCESKKSHPYPLI